MLEDFPGFLLEVDDDAAVVEAPEDEGPVDGVAGVDGVVVPPVPVPVPPGVAGVDVDRVPRRYTGLTPRVDVNILDPSADIEAPSPL